MQHTQTVVFSCSKNELFGVSGFKKWQRKLRTQWTVKMCVCLI